MIKKITQIYYWKPQKKKKQFMEWKRAWISIIETKTKTKKNLSNG